MPDRTLIWTTPAGVDQVTDATLPEEVGAKASGLLWLPAQWVPQFFVLSPEFRDRLLADKPKRRDQLIDSWSGLFEEGLRQSGLEAVSGLYLRSNAVHETLTERGRLLSVSCTRAAWRDALRTVLEQGNAEPGERIGVIVQRHVKALASGHLSNERRVAREFRDAVMEVVDAGSGEMTQRNLSFRRWRNTLGATTDALVCRTPDELSTVLREPLAYAAAEKKRVHFEWVWDGAVVYVVQADHSLEQTNGVSPVDLAVFHQSIGQVPALSVFRSADVNDAKVSRKLRSHLLYADHGFKQPTLFVLRDDAIIQELLDGSARPAVRTDLEALTHRPLIIRTSAPSGSGTLLPRSDQLHTGADAVRWLTGPFATEIKRRGLSPRDLMLIAHHYIPATSAAFSTGSPSSRDVYIEALWGIPEGLYYYPCDAYLVDTQSVSSESLSVESMAKFRTRDDIRFKGEFVAPNEHGKFVVCTTLPPWDWKPTIAAPDVAHSIALFTRQLAALEQKPIKVMWFLGCAPQSGLSPVLPWYHDDEAADWQSTGTSYERNSRDEVIQLRTTRDLDELEQKAREAYDPPGVRRLVVLLNPIEDRVIRDEAIAERVGNAASKLRAVVELRGGILSHLYYVLRRTGADVAVRYRPTFARQSETFNKLVRDKIPSVVAAGGESVKVKHLAPEELATALKIKLVEEAFEARDASSANLIHEIADVLDVIDALIKNSGIGSEDLASIRRVKQAKRGGFEDGVVLLETSMQSRSKTVAAQPESMLPPETDTNVVESARPAELEPSRAGPFDVREADNFVEFVHTMSVGLTHSEWELASPQKIRVKPNQLAESIEWTVEGKRTGGQLKLRLKIRIGTQQLRLPFD